MRLSIKNSEAGARWFEIADKAADMGYFTRLGKQFSCVPDVEDPWPAAIVKRIRAEFDPDFTPVYVREAWLTPAKTTIIVGRHMAARYRPNPSSDLGEPLNAIMPATGWYAGVRFRGPIFESTTLEVQRPLNALDAVERESGGNIVRELNAYVPFDNRVLQTFRSIWHQNHNMRVKDIKAEVVAAQLAADAAPGKAAADECRDRLKDEWRRLERLRKAETEYDRNRAAAPPTPQPYVFHFSGASA